MQERTYKIIDEQGIHARPASLLVKTSSQFESDINLEYKEKKANLKSIMAVMALGIGKNAEIKIIAEGSDEEKAIEELDELLKKEGLVG